MRINAVNSILQQVKVLFFLNNSIERSKGQTVVSISILYLKEKFN